MKIVKKILLTLIIFSLVVPVVVGAAEFINPLVHGSFEELIHALINILFMIAVVFAPLMIVIGAFYMMMPDEKGDNIETGKKIILYTVIGFIIIIAANGIAELLEGIFISPSPTP